MDEGARAPMSEVERQVYEEMDIPDRPVTDEEIKDLPVLHMKDFKDIIVTTTLTAEGRVRLYMELSKAYNLADEIIYDERFRSEEWPRRAYCITRDDMDEVFKDLDRWRKTAVDLHDGMHRLLLEALQLRNENRRLKAQMEPPQ